MRFNTMAFVAAMIIAAPAIAQTAPAADSAPKPVKEKKICRRETTTGSIIGARSTCHTKSEWAAIDAANARSTDDMLSHPNNRAASPQ